MNPDRQPAVSEPVFPAALVHVIAAGEAWEKAALLATLGPPTDHSVWPAPILPPAPGRAPRHRVADEPPRRRQGLGHPHGRLLFFHALHHIELSAIDLAAACCWWGSGMPAEFHADFLDIAREEASHAALIEDLLVRRGFPPGSAPVHHRLWQTARRCQDLGDHLVAVPRVLEARGLDITASLIDRLRTADVEAAAVLDRIYADEIRHVAAGTRWHSRWCQERSLDPGQHFHAVCERILAGEPASPFPLDLVGRRAAGFSEAELQDLQQQNQVGGRPQVAVRPTIPSVRQA